MINLFPTRALIVSVVLLITASFVSADTSVFSPDYIKSTMLKVVDWQLKHPKHKANDWTNGAFYAGVFAAYETTKSPVVLDSLMAMGKRMKWQPGSRFDHADDIAISQTYINLYRLKKDRRMIQPTIDTVRKMSRIPGREVELHGITWWWCDALFMAPPVLAQLGTTLKDPSYYALNDTLFRQTYKLLYNPEEHLFARDGTYLWNAAGQGKKESNGKKLFWSRGNGWVMGGLVLLLQELPKNHPTRNWYVDLYKEMADAYPGGEGSGSGFDCYALAWGINQGILDKKTYLPTVQKAWTALNTLVSPEGRVGWVQPIGADPRRNFSVDSWEVYGSGAFLLAGSEVIKIRGLRKL